MIGFASFAIGGFVPSAAIAGVLLLIGLGAGIFNACSQITLFRASKINLPMMVINGWSFTLAAIFMVPVLI
mgnify:CR=1 FL=1